LKLAFFTHDVGIYGAARSLSSALRGLRTEGLADRGNLWLFHHEDPHTSAPGPSELFEEIPNRIRCYLPFSKLYVGSVVRPHGLEWAAQALKARRFLENWYTHVQHVVEQQRFDCIHLNSHVLWPLLLVLPKKVRVVVHIRDLVDKERFRLRSSMMVKLIQQRADCIIAIDRLTADPFVDSGKVTVLTNPVDMEAVYSLRNDLASVHRRFGLSSGKRYVAQIGQISELKGAERFLTLAEKYVHRPDLHFLLVGGDTTAYSAQVLARARALPNMSWLGEISDIESVYAVADLVVRSDAFLPLGRTMWEAHFAGCKVVIPAREGDDTTEISTLLNRGVWLYRATDVCHMAEVLEAALGARHSAPELHGNSRAYTARFWSLLGGPAMPGAGDNG